MPTESLIRYQRENPINYATVIDAADLSVLGSEQTRELMEKLGLTPDELAGLLNFENIPTDSFTTHELFNANGEKTEEVESSIIPSGNGPMQVARILAYPSILKDSYRYALRPNEGAARGFEVIYGLKGRAILSFPNTVTERLGVYYASSQKKDVGLERGSLAIISTGVAYGWSHIEGRFRYSFIAQPPWNANMIVPVIDEKYLR